MNSNFMVLMGATETALGQEYKDYCGGYAFVMTNLADGSTSVRYVDVQSKVINVIRHNRQTANQLNDYFDSDIALANSLIDYLVENAKVQH